MKIDRLLALLAVCLTAACATTRVETDGDPNVDWAGFRTFALSAAPPGPLADRIREEIADQLERRGLRAERGAGELAVRFEHELVRTSRRSYASDPDANFLVSKPYTEQRLKVTVADSRTGDVIWTATGRTEVEKQEDLETITGGAIQEIFAAFPRPPMPATGA